MQARLWSMKIARTRFGSPTKHAWHCTLGPLSDRQRFRFIAAAQASAIELLVGAEDAPFIERDPALRLQVGGDARALGHVVVQRHETRDLLLEPFHPFRKCVAQPVDDLEQAQIDITELAAEDVRTAAFPQQVFEIAKKLRHTVAPELLGVTLRRRLLVFVIE